MIRNPSITYLIASVGHTTLDTTLRSLYGQFGWGLDKVKVYFDAQIDAGIEYFDTIYNMYHDRDVGSIEFITLEKNLGWWGHGIRNLYQRDCTTDYTSNIDDDDIYCTNIIPTVRSHLKDNYGKLLMYKFRIHNGDVVWVDQIIRHGNVGTPSGLIPNRPEIYGEWGCYYGGDAQFYETMQNNIGIENIVWKPDLLVLTRPHIYGF